MRNALFALLVGIVAVQGTVTPAVAESETAFNPYGWIGTETVKTPFGISTQERLPLARGCHRLADTSSSSTEPSRSSSPK